MKREAALSAANQTQTIDFEKRSRLTEQRLEQTIRHPLFLPPVSKNQSTNKILLHKIKNSVKI